MGLTANIIAEVGKISDSAVLDRRLQDCWAELRVLDQLLREGFTAIEKVTETADFIAWRGSVMYAIQVTRVNVQLGASVVRRNSEDRRDPSPYGTIKDIHERLDTPTSYLFWDRLNEKNGKFSKWSDPDTKRMIVIVTNQESLQDSMQRHIACQQIWANIYDLQKRHFEELLWLLDNGNGALFVVGEDQDRGGCWAQWNDDLPGPDTNYQPTDMTIVNRQPLNLHVTHPMAP